LLRLFVAFAFVNLKQKTQELKTMKIRATFVKDGKWWMAWTEDVPGALTQGATLDEARENLIDAVHLMQEPVDLTQLPKPRVLS
jgi:predicted RNase H-like HicB family nuclease